jgi:uncharacterized protein GlcG (DUF336 family)
VVKKQSISSELAEKMVDAAVAKARELGVSVIQDRDVLGRQSQGL